MRWQAPLVCDSIHKTVGLCIEPKYGEKCRNKVFAIRCESARVPRSSVANLASGFIKEVTANLSCLHWRGTRACAQICVLAPAGPEQLRLLIGSDIETAAVQKSSHASACHRGNFADTLNSRGSLRPSENPGQFPGKAGCSRNHVAWLRYQADISTPCTARQLRHVPPRACGQKNI